MRILYLIIGCLSLASGIIGIFLPLVPTTSFLLLSAFCFARSSDTFYKWLVTHPRLGAPIQDWKKYGCINKKSKILAILMIIFSIVISIVLDVPKTMLIIQILILSAVSTFILTRPTQRKH